MLVGGLDDEGNNEWGALFALLLYLYLIICSALLLIVDDGAMMHDATLR
jgi:hypothetical protein